MTKIPTYIVDAFTSKPFGGNPAAVCLLAKDIPDSTKQKLAMEMNLSETAFVLPITDEGATTAEDPFKSGKRFSLRWFTPMVEVPLCGHATLASAAVLFYVMGNKQSVEFVTRVSGVLTAERRDADGVNDNGCVEMKLPLNPATIRIGPDSNADVWKLVKTVLVDVDPHEVWLSPTTKKLLIRLEDNSRKFLENLKVDKEAMTAIDTADAVRGVIVTTKNDGCTYDFVSRYFAPWVGITEDPVTGSAHTVLAPFWSGKLGKNKLFARQCSARGGELKLELAPDCLLVRGEAVVVLEGAVNV